MVPTYKQWSRTPRPALLFNLCAAMQDAAPALSAQFSPEEHQHKRRVCLSLLSNPLRPWH